VPSLLRRVSATLALSLAGAILVALPATALEPLEELSLGGNGVGVAVTPDGLTAYMTNPDSDTVTVIDLITMSVVTTINVGNDPKHVTISPDGTIGVVMHVGSNTVQFFTTSTNALLGGAVTVGTGPFDAAFTADGSKVWITNYNTPNVSVIDVATRTVDSTITSTWNFIEGIELSRDGTVFWITETNGALWTYNASTGALIDSLGLPGFLTDIVLSPDGTRGYVPDSNTPKVHVIDTSDPTDISVIDTLHFDADVDALDVNAIELSADGTLLYASLDIYFDSEDTIGVMTLATEAIEFIPGFSTPRDIDLMPTGNGFLVVDYPGRFHFVADPVIRLTGTNRYGTGVKISKEGFPGGSDVVYVSTGLTFPDALAAGPAAALLNGPVLLTDPTTMPADVRAEIVRLDPERIVVVGGPDRVSNAILADLNTIAPADRITGSDRFETSRDIAIDAFDTASNGGGATDVYIATGLNFPDALAAGAAGATFGRPVLLVNGTQPTVDQATLDTLDALGAVNIFVVGGPNMVSEGIVTQLGATRLTGLDRFGTAVEINQDVFGTDSARRAIIATGLAFPDALAASALAGQIEAPLFLAPTNCVPAAVLTELTVIGVTQVTLVGGADRLTQAVFDLTSC
jgi:YVTN family beta-propeller protein